MNTRKRDLSSGLENTGMRLSGIVSLIVIGIVGVWTVTSDDGEHASETRMVLVELFTSEGCSSCPPADALLTDLAHSGEIDGATIVPLAFHVDYWNNLGWKDPFSEPSYTQRQYKYAASANTDRVYTPQMIVDGTEAFVGSDRKAATRAIENAASQPKGQLTMAVSEAKSGEVSIRIDASGIAIGQVRPNLYVAITENDLVSNVTRGENAGKTLHHTGVVRTFKEISVDRANTGTLQQDVTLPLAAHWDTNRLHVVSFVQDPESRKVFALATIPLKR